MVDKEKEEFKKQINDYLSQIVTDYAAENITYEEARDIVGTISDMQINNMDEDIAVASGSLSTLKASKTAYKNGIIQMEKENYIGAMEYFEAVIETDINYEDANKKLVEAGTLQYNKIKEEMLAEAENFIKNTDYKSAFDLIENFKNENNIVDEDLDKIHDAYIKDYIKIVTGKVDDLIANKDFITAFDVVSNASATIECDEFSALYEKIKSDYVLIIKEKVEDLINNEDYLQAINILNNAQEIVDSEEFAELKTRIEQEKPVYLSDLKYQTSNQFELIEEGEVITDTIGNTYTPNGNLYEMTNSNDGWNENNGSVEYYLGYSYSKMYFKVAVDDISSNISSVMTIYGDDVALYTLNLDRKTVPTEVVIDVSNVNYLSINLAGASDGNITAIIFDGYLE